MFLFATITLILATFCAGTAKSVAVTANMLIAAKATLKCTTLDTDGAFASIAEVNCTTCTAKPFVAMFTWQRKRHIYILFTTYTQRVLAVWYIAVVYLYAMGAIYSITTQTRVRDVFTITYRKTIERTCRIGEPCHTSHTTSVDSNCSLPSTQNMNQGDNNARDTIRSESVAVHGR